jgi:polyisoprenoid-binding protein YceI
MFKRIILLAVVSILPLAFHGKALTTSGSWELDASHSNAQLSTDGTTDFGKSKTTFTIGFARLNGTVKLDGDNPANSAFDFRFYPAMSMAPSIDEHGNVKLEWFTHYANNTLVCFHSKGTRQAADGRLQTTGTLVLTRVDRNIELTPNESYAGPVYGPPILHRVTHEATFLFDPPTATGAAFQTSGSTNVIREDFPQLLKAVTGTYWPPVVQEKHCGTTGEGEGYAGSHCTGSFLAPSFPTAPTGSLEDYPGPSGFNQLVGEHLGILVRMRLTPSASAATGN